jgi:hypothetical protein
MKKNSRKNMSNGLNTQNRRKNKQIRVGNGFFDKDMNISVGMYHLHAIIFRKSAPGEQIWRVLDQLINRVPNAILDHMSFALT